MKLNSNFKFVELHNHLDGSIKAETIQRICKRKHIEMPHSNAENLKSFLNIKESCDLRTFLKKFETIQPIIQGDQEAIAEICDDFIKTAADSKICYIEARFSPEFLSSDSLSTDSVVKTVLESMRVAGDKYGVVARIILCSLRQENLISPTALDLAMMYKPHGVVGIDLAGDEQHSMESMGTKTDIKKMFQRAKHEGIHRTVHAGENGSAELVKEAIVELHAERIGHGYQILNNEDLYQEIKKMGIHFEMCPSSSFLTGAVHENPDLHPFHRFSRDNLNYSISCDDTMITGRNLQEEYLFCKEKFNISDEEIIKSNFNAANASFLDEDDKRVLIEHLNQAFKTIHI